ncbi:Flp pilus assembly protein CpaB [Chlorobium sp. N1]|uniref:Flp pilus assembly protein CpaB n=1 Tax=Chlorobium sp. N1 TaxID=2491138 RepID=UPI00103B6825|nr:Flp pilus assembly protein CpaB [Chlorobium sp. N1]TCD47229.1 Flp pilus assembly protein CpaB [Chlorobium sp. N1]
MKQPIIAAVALTMGATAAFITARSLQTDASSGHTVVIVEQPIEAGKAIAAMQVRAVDWPGSTVPHEAKSRTADVVGRIARVSMIPGEPILPGKLAPINATGGLSSIIPEGKRAITVKVNEVISVAGFALPGSYVDVLVSGKDASRQPFSRTVLSRVKVLAAAQETTAEPDKPKVVSAVTLELSPVEAEKLDLARSIGDLSLVLRNELDTGEVNSAGVRLGDIVYPNGPAKSSPKVARAAPVRRYSEPEEIRGTVRGRKSTP